MIAFLACAACAAGLTALIVWADRLERADRRAACARIRARGRRTARSRRSPDPWFHVDLSRLGERAEAEADRIQRTTSADLPLAICIGRAA